MTIGIAIHHKLTTTPIVLTMIGKKKSNYQYKWMLYCQLVGLCLFLFNCFALIINNQAGLIILPSYTILYFGLCNLG
jgi:hypothetical protein